MRILLVEDEESIREALRLNLELEGYEVVSIANGKKALDLIGAQHFDLLLLDVMLPDVDGFTITEQVRLTFKAPERAATIEPEGWDDPAKYLCLVMPLRLMD